MNEIIKKHERVGFTEEYKCDCGIVFHNDAGLQRHLGAAWERKRLLAELREKIELTRTESNKVLLS